jgi:hypothetical protein
VLYVVNSFDAADYEGVKSLVHTVEHEFGHILHQTVAYPAEFKTITSAYYTANWPQVPLSEARVRGFITSYAMASPDEDFVEMISVMLIEGKAGYEKILACETNQNAKALLRQKEQIVVEYFKRHFQIDFYELQEKVQAAMAEFAEPPVVEEKPPVTELWGYSKTYKSLVFDLNFMPLPANFTAQWAADYNKLRENGYGLHTYFRLQFIDENQVRLQEYFYEDTESGRMFHEANFMFEFAEFENTHVFYFIDADENARRMIDEFGAHAIPDYFISSNYELDWERSSCPSSNYVGFYPARTPNLGSTFGQLSN